MSQEKSKHVDILYISKLNPRTGIESPEGDEM
jgi:hypothetical protein